MGILKVCLQIDNEIRVRKNEMKICHQTSFVSVPNMEHLPKNGRQ